LKSKEELRKELKKVIKNKSDVSLIYEIEPIMAQVIQSVLLKSKNKSKDFKSFKTALLKSESKSKIKKLMLSFISKIEEVSKDYKINKTELSRIKLVNWGFVEE